MNRNVEVPASGDFGDMPVRIKIAINREMCEKKDGNNL